jgi:hypothetical protein
MHGIYVIYSRDQYSVLSISSLSPGVYTMFKVTPISHQTKSLKNGPFSVAEVRWSYITTETLWQLCVCSKFFLSERCFEATGAVAVRRQMSDVTPRA